MEKKIKIGLIILIIGIAIVGGWWVWDSQRSNVFTEPPSECGISLSCDTVKCVNSVYCKEHGHGKEIEYCNFDRDCHYNPCCGCVAKDCGIMCDPGPEGFSPGYECMCIQHTCVRKE